MPRTTISMPRTTAGTRTAVTNRFRVRDFQTCLNYVSASSQSVGITQTLGLPVFSQAGYSVSFWINRKYMAANGAVFGEANSGSNNQAFVLGTSNTGPTYKARAFIRNNANVAQLNSVLSTTVLHNNTWNHILWTDNNGTCVMYINGVVDTQNFNYTPTGVYTFNRTSLGALIRLASVDYFDGKIDEVAAYSRVLTPTEASNIYFLGDYPSTNLVGHWKADEGSGTSLTDSSGNGNTGTITGATYSSEVFMTERATA